MPPSPAKSPTHKELSIIATSLAHQMVRNSVATIDTEDLIQEGLSWAHKGFQQTPSPRKPYAFARTIMQWGMRSYYNKHDTKTRYGVTEESLVETSAFHAACHVNIETELEERLVLEQYYSALECTHGHMARRIAENLVTPSDKDLCVYVIEESARLEQCVQEGLLPP
ncbi:hypothetical protein LCGC14_2359130, partial [marine sediment metagenome]